MLTWKYTLPAFLVPLVFTLTPEGSGLLLQNVGPAVVWTILTAAIGIAAFAAAFGGWIFAPARPAERILMGLAGSLLLVAEARADLLGIALISMVLILHYRRRSLN